MEATDAEANTAGEGGCHEAINRKMEGVAGRWENPSGNSSRVGEREGGLEDSGVA